MSIKPTKDRSETSREFKNKTTRIKKPIKADYPRDSHYVNVKRNIIEIEESKLELCARDYEEDITASMEWHTPIGTIVTIVFTLFTANFKSDIFEKIAIFSLGASVLWLGIALYKKLFYNKNNRKKSKEFVISCKNFDVRNEQKTEVSDQLSVDSDEIAENALKTSRKSIWMALLALMVTIAMFVKSFFSG